jgi:hypothetical protein
MKVVNALRLMLDVFGALFLGMLAIAPVVFGVLPYEGLRRLGTIPFYGLLAAAFLLWLWLATRVFVADARQADAAPRSTR